MIGAKNITKTTEQSDAWMRRAQQSLDQWAAHPDEQRRALAALDVWLALRRAMGDNVDQRTPEWYARRGKSVGGSQLGKLAGLSKWGGPWQTVEDLAKAQGWGGGAYRGWLPAAAWGTLLEPLSPLLLAALGAVCREPGARWGRVRGHSNSPDGVAWLELGRLGRLVRSVTTADGEWVPTPEGLDPDDPRNGGALRVLEYKSAYSRVLDDRPSAEHMAQLHGGLDAVPLAKDGLLLNTVARRCELRQWRMVPGFVAMPEALAAVVFHFGPPNGGGLSKSPDLWPQSPAGGAEGYPPITGGRSPKCADLFAFVKDIMREPNESEQYAAARLRLLWLRDRLRGTVLDLGTVTPDVVSEVVWMTQHRILWPAFVARFPDRVASGTARLEALSEAGVGWSSAVAVMPIKMMVIEGHVTDRQSESTTEKLRPRIWGALDCAAQLVGGADPDEVRDLFGQYTAGAKEPPPPPLLSSARFLHEKE
jgi:hypothetical protein